MGKRVVVCALLIVLCFQIVAGVSINSSNYKLSAITPGGGGKSNTSTYNLYSIIGEPIVGVSNTSVYNAWLGFFYGGYYKTNWAPETPTLIAPATGSRQIENSVTLNYTSSDKDGDNINFTVNGDTNADPSTQLYYGTNESYVWSTADGNTYFWKVKAYDGQQYSAFSGVWSFVENSKPTQSDPIITPSTPTAAQNFTCEPADGNDAEGDTITYVHNWIKDGSYLAVLNMPFDYNTSLKDREVKDYSGSGNNASIEGATWNSTGIRGGAYYFDGTGQLNVTDSASLDLTNALTITVWGNDPPVVNFTPQPRLPEPSKPKILDGFVKPTKVLPGDEMLVSAHVASEKGVAGVLAEMGHDLGSDDLLLELVDGTIYDGLWQATWTVHDTVEKAYNTKLTALDMGGRYDTKTLRWHDPTESVSTYEFSDTTNNKAYYKNGTASNPFDYDSEVNAGNYSALATSDNSRSTVALATQDGGYDTQVYTFTINEAISDVSNLTVEWEGYGEDHSGFYTNISFWNWSGSTWKEVDNNDFTASTDATLTGAITSDVSDFINSSNKMVAVRVTTKKNVPSWSWCYQETANESHASDGGCSLNYSGSYSCSGWWDASYPCQRGYDGDWDTNAASDDYYGGAYLFINYTKPIGATNESKWQMETELWGTPVTTNYTLDSLNCYSQDPVRFKILADEKWDSFDAWCYNGTGFVSIDTFQEGNSQLFEEAMYWYISSSPYIYTYQEGDYNFVSDFIAGATSKGKGYTSFTDVTNSEPDDGVIKLKITEKLNETTYLDQVYLRVDGDGIIRLSSITDADINLLQSSDNNYLVMNQGAVHYLEFDAPENYEKLEFAAEGYYIKHSSETGTHNSLNTDYIELRVNSNKYLVTNLPAGLDMQVVGNSSYNLTSIAIGGEKNVLINKSGTAVVNFSMNFNQDTDFSGITADINATLSVFHIDTSTHTNVNPSFTLRIPVITGTNKTYICPNATALTEVYEGCTNMYYVTGLTNESGYYHVKVSGSGGGEGEGMDNKTLINKSGAYMLRLTDSANVLHGRINDKDIYADVSVASDWHHYAMSYDRTSIKLYIDGVEVNSTPYTTAIAINANDLYIGQNFTGRLDEVAIYQVALSPQQIYMLYNESAEAYNYSTIVDNETSKGETWTCEVTPIDGYEAGTMKTDSETLINAVPSVPTLLAPDNDTTTTNRSVFFNWTASTDTDQGDTITYNIAVDNNSDFSSPEINETGISTANYTNSNYLNVSQNYYWKVRAYDGSEYSAYAKKWNFSITEVVSISLLVSSTDFKAMQPGDQSNTTDDSPQPMVIRNDGNIPVNITIDANQSLFTSEALDTKYFQAKPDDNETGSYDSLLSPATWINISDSKKTIVAGLEWNNSADEAEIELNIEVPQGESSITEVRSKLNFTVVS